MRTMLRHSLLFAALAASGNAGAAQSSNALVGAWERFSLKDSTGAVAQPPAAAAFLIMSGDGFYSQTSIPEGRPKLNSALADLTKDDLVTRYTRTEARRGRYTVAGNVLTRTYVASINPNDEGSAPQVQQFRIEGDVLVLTSTRPGNMSEARFRRAK